VPAGGQPAAGEGPGLVVGRLSTPFAVAAVTGRGSRALAGTLAGWGNRCRVLWWSAIPLACCGCHSQCEKNIPSQSSACTVNGTGSVTKIIVVPVSRHTGLCASLPRCCHLQRCRWQPIENNPCTATHSKAGCSDIGATAAFTPEPLQSIMQSRLSQAL